MLPEVAGRSISPFHVSVAGRVTTKRTLWIEASVTVVDLKNERLQYSLSDGRSVCLSFKHLVLACGDGCESRGCTRTECSFFSPKDGWRRHPTWQRSNRSL